MREENQVLKVANFLGVSGKKKGQNEKNLNYDDFDWIKISLASPEKIKKWSYQPLW